MIDSTIHNPDRYMIDLRQILSQGRKRIGILIGAGAPTSIKVNQKGNITLDGQALIPDVAGLTSLVLSGLEGGEKEVVDKLTPQMGENPNIEAVLTRIRKLAQAIGNEKVFGLSGNQYAALGEKICEKIGGIVRAKLPPEQNSYTELVSWVGGTHREHSVEIFTSNYDLLFEEAFERAKLPYFDGFTGAHLPFFDPVSIEDDLLPARWSKLWKLHGSLGWDMNGDSIVRTGGREATKLIYPDHLKYDQITRQPYSALFERLRKFLTTPDTLLICAGFSFNDAHICAVLDEALATNAHTAVLAFQYKSLEEETMAVKLALTRPNLSVYAREAAVIYGVKGKWKPGELPSEDWAGIRSTYWNKEHEDDDFHFVLGGFAKLSRFFALAQASNMLMPQKRSVDNVSEDNRVPPLLEEDE